MSASISVQCVTKSTDKAAELELTATGTQMPSQVFAVELIPGSTDPTVPSVRFSHVCSLRDLNELTADAPGGSCYYRVASIRLILADLAEAARVKALLKADIAQLVHNYNELNGASSVTETWTIA